MTRLEKIHAGWNNGKRWKIIGIAAVILLSFTYGTFVIWFFNRPQPAAQLKPWAPITTPDTERIACLNVVVPGVCLPSETVTTDEDGPGGNDPVQVMLPTMHVPRNSEFPDIPIKTQRCVDSQVDTKYDSWTQEIVPIDGTYDHSAGTNTLLAGCTPFTVSRPIGPEQVARVKQLASRGITTTVWQVRGTQDPTGPIPDGYTPVGINFSTDNYAIVYGG